jgi:dynein heavy chain
VKLHIPRLDTVFQYYYEPSEMKFRHIKNIVPRFEYRLESSYFSLFVPTVDSVCYAHLLDILLKINKKAFFTGNTGVGKSILIQQFIENNQEALNLAPIILNLSA